MKTVNLVKIAVIVPLMVIGCGKGHAPVETLSKADVAVQGAESEPMTLDAAPLELRLAREKLDKAKAAMNKKDYLLARRLAEEATVEANLAQAKAKSAKSDKALNETRKSIEALQQEADKQIAPH